MYWPHFGHNFLVSGQGRTIPLMKRFRFARLRLRVAAIGWLGIIISLSVLIWDFIINADFLVSKWPQKSRPMPAEMWVFFGSLLWLLVVAFWPELDKSEQPDLPWYGIGLKIIDRSAERPTFQEASLFTTGAKNGFTTLRFTPSNSLRK